MVDQKLVERLLLRQRTLRQWIERRKIGSYEELESDLLLQKGIEKMLQEMIEICLDIGKHIISDESMPLPENNKEVFRVLARHGVISDGMSDKLGEMVGFRNLLVHLYEKIDLTVVYAIVKKHLKDFVAFEKAIQTFTRRRR